MKPLATITVRMAAAACLCFSMLTIGSSAQVRGANHPPVAIAGPDLNVGTVGVEHVAVTLYGAASYDPDGDPLSYAWTDAAGHPIGSTAVVSVTLALGPHAFVLTVSDGRGGTGSDSVLFIVVGDTDPPIVMPPPDITVGITTDTGAKGADDDDLAAFLRHSYAGDGLDTTPTFLGADVNGQPVDDDFEFPIGTTPVRFRWRDHAQNVGSATATVTVLDHLKRGDLLVGEAYPVDYSTVGRIERIRNGVATLFCDSPLSSFDPMWWDGPSDVIVDSKGRVVFLASAPGNQGSRLLRCTRPGEPPELIANFARNAVDAPPTATSPFPRYAFNQVGALHLAKRTLITINNEQNGGWPKIADDETYNLQVSFSELETNGFQTKTLAYHVATGQWDTSGPAGVVFPNFEISGASYPGGIGDMFFNGGTTYAVRNSNIRAVVDPFQIDAGLKIGSVFSGKLSLMLGGGEKEYNNLIMNDRGLPDVPLPPTVCGGASVPSINGGFAPLSGLTEVVFDTWGDRGLIATSNYGFAAPFLTGIDTDMLQPGGAPASFPQPFLGCQPQPEVFFDAPLPFYNDSNGHSNSVDKLASTRLGIVGTRFWGNDVVRIPPFGGQEVETIIGNIWHPMGIAGFPAKIAGSYGAVIGISIQSPVNILLTDAQGRRLGMNLETGEPVNDFGTDAVDSGAGTEPRYFFVRNPAPGAYTVRTVGTGEGPYTVDVYAADVATGLGGRLTHTGAATVGAAASHDFVLGADNTLAFATVSGNRAPTAVAGADQVVDATSASGAPVHLDGSGSSDADGDVLTYRWTGPFGILTGAAIDAIIPTGTHAITLTVEDGRGGSGKAAVVVTVNATLNAPPSAAAGADQVVEATSPAGATVVFDGSASSDPDHDALTFTWSGAFGVLSGMKPSVVLPLGVHTIALAVDDGHGHTAVSATHVTVRDTVAPAITIASPSGTYLIGQAAVASYSCADGGAGVTSCRGPIANGGSVPTTVGASTFTVVATDAAGNTSSQSTVYQVGYAICPLTRDGFDDDDEPGLIRLRLCTAAGVNLSAPGIVVTAARLVNAATHAPAPFAGADRALAFTFDPSRGSHGTSYKFNLNPQRLPAGRYELYFAAAGDPTEHHVDVTVRNGSGRSQEGKR